MNSGQSFLGEFEVVDDENVVVLLSEQVWKHIVERRGEDFIKWWNEIKDTIQNPDFKCRSKNKPTTKVYVKKNNSKRNFPSKYLLVFVSEDNVIKTSYFSKTLKGLIT